MSKQIKWRCSDEIIRAGKEGPAGNPHEGEAMGINICPRVSRGLSPVLRDESLKIIAISTLCLDEPL